MYKVHSIHKRLIRIKYNLLKVKYQDSMSFILAGPGLSQIDTQMTSGILHSLLRFPEKGYSGK